MAQKSKLSRRIRDVFRRPSHLQQPHSSGSSVTTSQDTSTSGTFPNNLVVTPPDTTSIPATSHSPFHKSAIFENDIAVLFLSYTLNEHPDLKRLVHLITTIQERNDPDEDGQVS